MAWLFHHLTEQERFEVATCIKRLETDQGDKQAEERIRVLLVEAERRGDEEAKPNGKQQD
jgi:hypothetical protein